MKSSFSSQISTMFRSFYPGSSLSDQFVSEVTSLGVDVSAAQLQGFFMFYKRSDADALANVFRLKGRVKQEAAEEGEKGKA